MHGLRCVALDNACCIKRAPATLFHLGANKVRFRGVAIKEEIKHSGCILVGEDNMIFPSTISGGK